MTDTVKQHTDSAGSKRYFFWLTVGLLFIVFVYLIRGVLLPFVLGAAIAYFLDPAADKLQKWRLSRTLATIVITGSFFVIVTLALLLIVPTLTSQFSELIVALPEYFVQFEQHYEPTITSYLGALPDSYMDSIKNAAANVSGIVIRLIGDVASGVFSSGVALVNILSLILITPVVAFYLLRDWDNIITRLYILLPRPHESTIREQLAIIDATLAGFIRGQLNVCLLLGTFYAVGLSIVGLKFAILIGLVTGFLTIIPYVGLLFGMGIGLTVAFFQFGDFESVLPVLTIFIVGQIIEGNFVTPKLVGEKVGLHPVWIIFGMLAGAALFGFVGVLIAVPATAVIGVLIRFALSNYLKSSYYLGTQSHKPK